MKAISLDNPYATLAAIGAKRYETRGWLPPKGVKEIAIHATAKRVTTWQPLFELEEFRAHLLNVIVATSSVLAVAEIGEIITTEEWFRKHCAKNITWKTQCEYLFGDYGPNRYAWELINIRPLPNPVPCRGQQRIWNLPDHVTEDVREQLRVLTRRRRQYAENSYTLFREGSGPE